LALRFGSQSGDLVRGERLPCSTDLRQGPGAADPGAWPVRLGHPTKGVSMRFRLPRTPTDRPSQTRSKVKSRKKRGRPPAEPNRLGRAAGPRGIGPCHWPIPRGQLDRSCPFSSCQAMPLPGEPPSLPRLLRRGRRTPPSGRSSCASAGRPGVGKRRPWISTSARRQQTRFVLRPPGGQEVALQLGRELEAAQHCVAMCVAGASIEHHSAKLWERGQ
jgi:hypothetical protein